MGCFVAKTTVGSLLIVKAPVILHHDEGFRDRKEDFLGQTFVTKAVERARWMVKNGREIGYEWGGESGAFNMGTSGRWLTRGAVDTYCMAMTKEFQANGR